MTHTGLSAEAVWRVLEPLGFIRRPGNDEVLLDAWRGVDVDEHIVVYFHATGALSLMFLRPPSLSQDVFTALAQLIAHAAEDGK